MVEFIPYQRVGEIKFGMNLRAVETALGPPKNRYKNWLGEMELLYEFGRVTFDNADKVVEVEYYPGSHVLFEGIDILDARAGRHHLLDRSQEKYVGLGSVVLLDLGAAIMEDPEADHTVSLFAKGRRDPLMHKYKKLGT